MINNPVSTTLVSNAGSTVALAASNVVLSALTDNQFGVFDASDDTAITKADSVTNFYVAVKNGTLIKRSPTFNKYDLTGYRFVEGNSGTSQAIEVRDYTIEEETTYIIRVEIRNNRVAEIQGHRGEYISFSYTAPKGETNPNQITRGLIDAINNNTSHNGILTATARLRSSDAAISDFATFISTGDGSAATNTSADSALSNIRITASALSETSSFALNTTYFYPRQTFINVSPTSGFTATTNVENVVSPVVAQGDGYDIAQYEMQDSGYVQPYRLEPNTGVNNQIPEAIAINSSTYDVITIQAARKIPVASGIESSNILARIAIVNSATALIGTTAGTGIIAVLNSIVDDVGITTATVS